MKGLPYAAKQRAMVKLGSVALGVIPIIWLKNEIYFLYPETAFL